MKKSKVENGLREIPMAKNLFLSLFNKGPKKISTLKDSLTCAFIGSIESLNPERQEGKFND